MLLFSVFSSLGKRFSMPNFEVNISLSSHEIINLLAGLHVLPPNGDWKETIIQKIHTQLEGNGLTLDEYKANSGIDYNKMKKHIELLQWREKREKDWQERKNAPIY